TDTQRPRIPTIHRGKSVLDPHAREPPRPPAPRRLPGPPGDREAQPTDDRLGRAPGRRVAVLADDEPATRCDDVVELVLQELPLPVARDDVEQHVDEAEP